MLINCLMSGCSQLTTVRDVQVSRLLEERVAAAEGVPNVRHWLQLIGKVLDHCRLMLATLVCLEGQ